MKSWTNKISRKVAVASALVALSMLAACAGQNNDESAPANNTGVGVSGQGNGSQGWFYTQNSAMTNLRRNYGMSTGETNMTLNSTNYKELLKNGMGVCDRGQSNGGSYDCRNWVSGAHEIVVQFTGADKAHVIFHSVPESSWLSYSFPSIKNIFLQYLGIPIAGQLQAYYNPLQLELKISPTNENQGIELSGMGPGFSGISRRIMRLRVDQGNATSASMAYTLTLEDPSDTWNGGEQAVLATGTLVRCTVAYCGM